MISNVATVATQPFWCTGQVTKSACDILSDKICKVSQWFYVWCSDAQCSVDWVPTLNLGHSKRRQVDHEATSPRADRVRSEGREALKCRLWRPRAR